MPRRRRRSPAGLGRPIPSCQVRLLVGFGKGKPLPRSPLRRVLNPQQALAAIQAATGRYFDGYSVTPVSGVYLNEGEPAVAIDVFRTKYDAGPHDEVCRTIRRKATCLAADLRSVLRQHSVLVMATPTRPGDPLTSDLVTRDRRGCPIARRARLAAIAAAKRG